MLYFLVKSQQTISHSRNKDPHPLGIGLGYSDELIKLYLHILSRRSKQLYLPAYILLIAKAILSENASQSEIKLRICEVHSEALAGPLREGDQVAVEAGVFEPALWTELVRGGENCGVLVDQGRRHAYRCLQEGWKLVSGFPILGWGIKGECTYSWGNLPIAAPIEEVHNLVRGHPL